jgi:hypothetical protein
MNVVRVKKDELRAKIQANRDRHREVFLDALDGYRAEAIRQLEEHIERIRAGDPSVVRVYIDAPEDHTADYDVVLAMIDMEVEDTIQLSHQAFTQYVMDDWSWKRAWLQTASVYAAESVSKNYEVNA